MKKMLIVMAHEIRTTLGRKVFTLLALGLPLLLGLVALVIILANRDGGSAGPGEAGATPQGDGPQAVGYVDPGGLIRTIPRDVPAGWLLPYPDSGAAQAALEAGEIDAYYLVPADYLLSGDLTYVRLEYQPLSDTSPDHGPMEWVLAVNLFDGDETAAARALHPLDVFWQQAAASQAPGQGDGGDSWITELLPNLMALILYMVILIPASTLIATVTDEKKNRVMEILVSSVSAGQLIGGKILALGVLGLLQMTVWAGVLWAVVQLGGEALNIPPGFSLPPGLLAWSLVFGLLGYAMYGSQMAGLGALVPDIKDSRGATMIVLLPLIAVYTFLVVIVQRPDSPFSVAVSLFPLTSPVGMIARMTAGDVPAWQPALAAALQLLTSILIVRGAARLFRAQTLVSGQPFSLKVYGRALFSRS